MGEEWKPIRGFEINYEISSMGRVRRISPAINSFIGRVLRPARSKNGYFNVALYLHGERHTKLVHVLVAEAFCVRKIEHECVNHKFGDKADNRASELEWMTHSENSQHAMRIGLWKHPMGTEHWGAKLNPEKADVIRKRYAAGGVTQKAIAEEYGVNWRTIWAVVNKVNWRPPSFLDEKTI